MKIMLFVAVKAKIFTPKLLGLHQVWKASEESSLAKHHFDYQLPADPKPLYYIP